MSSGNKRVTVSLLKIVTEKKNLSGNFDKLMKMLEKAANPDIDVYITPERYLDG